jgi:EAL domain-containing protein (putative c-di-GMP-specific phosphodiesterase class I)
VAEGVETAQEAQMVHALGCDLVQGHYVAVPMKAGDFLRWAQNYGGRN